MDDPRGAEPQNSADQRSLAEDAGRIAALASIFVGLVGSTVLLGWLTGADSLKSVIAGMPSMKANTAIGFMLAGLGLWAVRGPSLTGSQRITSRVIGAVLFSGACLTLVEHIAGTDLGIDHLFADASKAEPGRPSPHISSAFTAVGLWLLFSTGSRPPVRVARAACGAAAAIIVLMAALGYLYWVRSIYNLSSGTGMAPHTIIAFLVLLLGMAAARSSEGFVGLLTSAEAGSQMARRITPAVIGIPILIGYFSFRAAEASVFNTNEAITVIVATNLLALIVTAFLIARRLNAADRERQILAARLRELAHRDPLTGLLNRRAFDAEIGRQLALARRHGTPVSVIILDFDDFKPVNDQHGHRAGDELLIAVTSIWRAQLRPNDRLARVGGDEFILVMPQTDRRAAETVARKLISSARKATATNRGNGAVGLTVSAGVASSEQGAYDADALVDLADRAMYAAKAGGGDRYEPGASPTAH